MTTEVYLVVMEVLKWIIIICFTSGFTMLFGVGVAFWWGSMSPEDKKLFIETMQINFLMNQQ